MKKADEEKILELFLKQGYSPYGIHTHYGFSIKTIYHVIKLHEDRVRKVRFAS